MKKKGVDWGKFLLLFSIAFLGLIFYGIKTCEKQAEEMQKELQEAGEKLREQVEKTGKEIEEAAERIPKKIIGDLHINFDELCTKAKKFVCDEANSEYCSPEDTIELVAFAGSREEKVCCEKECSSTPYTTRMRYPIVYVGGESLLTCAFQKGNDCRLDKYCYEEQWLRAKDTETCCKADCLERVQHKEVFFAGLGYTTVERFSSNRFGVWYGSGNGEGFYELGKPDYSEAQRIGETKYFFLVAENKYGFEVLQNDPSIIRVNVTAVQ